MINQKVSIALENLEIYCKNKKFAGYDPYDTLNSFINFRISGKYLSAIAIQIQKRNPLNIRPLLGIKRGINPKGMGLFLKAYSILYKKTGAKEYLLEAKNIFQWLQSNFSAGYSGKCWGYNFDWASPVSYLNAYTPSVVVTSFVIDGIFEYYKLTKDPRAAECILSSADYILKNIPISKLDKGISFSYTHQTQDVCYNASLLAAEILAKANLLESNPESLKLIKDALEFVLSRQKSDGSWYYSFDINANKERRQIDFHQGFILVSLHNILELTGLMNSELVPAISKGLEFYKKEQFDANGRAMWRLPKKWPVDIHNQSQGIITFSHLREYHPDYYHFARTIAKWTINNMLSKKGYFYYRLTPLFINKISYMRWSQAWMMLALAEVIEPTSHETV